MLFHFDFEAFFFHSTAVVEQNATNVPNVYGKFLTRVDGVLALSIVEKSSERRRESSVVFGKTICLSIFGHFITNFSSNFYFEVIRSLFGQIKKKIKKWYMYSIFFSETWCNDDPVCAKYTETNCNEDWLKVNCPKKCKICGNGQ